MLLEQCILSEENNKALGNRPQGSNLYVVSLRNPKRDKHLASACDLLPSGLYRRCRFCAGSTAFAARGLAFRHYHRSGIGWELQPHPAPKIYILAIPFV
jgi:hypothetical protein